MDLEIVKKIIATIESCKYNDEMAHILEDDLFYKFVNAIKDGKYKTKKEIIEVANEVYKVRAIEFGRWYS
jgi:hypothetical protein